MTAFIRAYPTDKPFLLQFGDCFCYSAATNAQRICHFLRRYRRITCNKFNNFL